MSLYSDLEVTARCYEIRSTHVHSSQTSKALQDLEALLKSCAGPWLLFNESSIAPLKHIARCHGLPRVYSEPLRLVITNSKDNPKFALQLALLLKYAQAKDPEFSKIQELLKLLKNYPPQEVAAKKEFFVLEIVTQLLLAVASSADHAQFETVRNELEDCKSYLPCVNAKFRTQIKGTFERMGFWTSSRATFNDFNLNAGAARNGEELIRSSHEKAGSKVSAHVVKTQQTQAITTEENVSEKTQMQNINLSNALQQGRAKCTSNVQQLSVSEAKNKSGSDRSWWKTTSTEITNFLHSARGSNVVKDDDIIYLRDKFGGYKFSFSQSGREMVAMIAEIFALISVYQKLETSTVIQLLKEVLHPDRSNGHYDRARQDILKMTEYHCARLRENGRSFPEEIRGILSKFKEDSSCTKSMQRTIWRILMNDQGDPSVNFELTLKLLRDPCECIEALDYINQVVAREENWTKLESLGLIPALLNIIIGAPTANADDKPCGALEDEPILPVALETVGFTSDSLWDLIPGRKIYRNLKEDLTFNFSTVTNLVGALNPVVLATDLAQSAIQGMKDRLCGKERAEDAAHARNEYSNQAQTKAVALLEEYLTLTGSQGLDVDIIVKLIEKSVAEGASSELSSPIIRCVLHTLDKNAQNPRFFSHLPDSILAFLFAASCFNPDKKLQVFTLAILSNLLNNAEINQWIVKGIRHIDFLRDKLLRRDIIYHNNGRVILEEELDKDFDFGENETSGDHLDFSCVSAIVARIFIATLQSKRNVCDESTICIAMRALFTSPDKMTRIYCTEYLFGAAKSGTKFTLPVLNDLQTFLFDSVADVRIHACASYCTAMANLTEAPLDHVCYLPNVYSFKTVLLGDEDFTPWINDKILNVMRAGAETHFFPEPVFHLLTLVLNGTCADSEESEAYSTVKLVLETIETYCTLPGRAETLPSVTIDAVENLLLESDVFDEQCARIIERCMMANHWVSDAVLEEFAKYLVYSPETSLPFLRRLCLANENQDLPMGIFENMQMELVGLRLWPKAWPNGPDFLRVQKFEHANEEYLLSTLMDYLANGKRLSPLNMSMLQYLLRTTQNPSGQGIVVDENDDRESGSAGSWESYEESNSENDKTNCFESNSEGDNESYDESYSEGNSESCEESNSDDNNDSCEESNREDNTESSEENDTGRDPENSLDDLAMRTEGELNKIEKLAVECLTMAGANGQGLSKNLIELALSSRIPSPLSFDLAIALVRQNQQLPQHFLQQVFKTTEKSTKDMQNVQLIMNMILRNFKLPTAVLRGYCQSILQVFEVEAITMDLLSSLVKLAEGPNARTDTASLLKEAFLRAIETNDSSIAGMGFKGLSLLGKELISSEDIKRIADKSQDPALREVLANFGVNWKENVWLPPDPSQVPENLLQETQSLIEQSRMRGLKLEFPDSWKRALKNIVCNDSAAALGMEKVMDNSEKVHPIEIQIAEALCYGLLNAKNDSIKTHCNGALSALIQRGASIEDLSKYMSMSNQDEDRKWELQVKGKEKKILTDLRAWQLNPEDKFAQARLSQHLQDKNVRQVYYKEIAETAQNVDKILWKEVPELAHSSAENLLRIGKVIGACVEVIEDHILLSTEAPSRAILAACTLAVKICRVENLLPIVQKCTKLLSPEAPHELKTATLQLFIQVSCQQQLPSSTVDAIINCISSKDASIRGRSFAVLLQQKSQAAIDQWNQIYNEPLKRIYEEIYQSVDQDVVSKQDELNDALMLTLYSLRTCDLRRLKNEPREQWCEILMASDFIQTFGSSIEEQIMMQPDAIKVARYLKSSVWLDFVQDFDQLRTTNPQVSVAQLLALVAHALEAASHDELADMINSMGFKENNLMELITTTLSKLLARRVTGISPSMATMIVHQLTSVLNIGHIFNLLCTVSSSLKLEDLEDFLNFAQAYLPPSSDLESVFNETENQKTVTLEDILQRLQLKTLMKNVPSAHAQYTNIENHLCALLNSRYSYHQLHDLFKLIKSTSKSFLTAQDARINALESVLFQMNNYGACAEWFPVILKSLRECEDPHSWIDRSNSLTMERIFSGSQGMKTLENILKELRELNPDMRDIYNDSMANVVRKIGSIGDFKSTICPELGEICKWNEDEIRTWASAVKGNLTTNAGEEALCVAKRAFFLFQNYHLTDIQIFAIISSLAKSNTRGLLLQVSTGSGKSTIIAIIAVMQALMGTPVDIFTSSPVLAERDAKEWAKFYGMFGLTCSHNGDKGSGYVRGEKVCYKKDVVYGDTSQFQFDALRDEYSGLSTRAGSAYAYAIVDEVDSMFIDDSSKLARLSSTLPGMDLLQVIYHLTWNRLHDVQRRLFALGPRMFYLEGRLEKSKDGGHSYHFIDENENICTIENLALFVLQNGPEDLERAKIQTVDEIEKFVADHLKDYIRVLIGDKTFEGGNQNQKIDLPKAIVKYARTQVNNWVDSAMTALTFQENVHYVIDDGQIKPVDFLTTGIVQSSTNWNNGLHQFLQIKHAIKVTTETVTTNFLSNGAMFQKYGGSLVGFTGTLGSSYGTQVLKDVYQVETVIVPELYFKRFLRMRDKVCVNYTQWLSAVLHSAIHESSKSRGVLIICQTIKFSELIAEELRKRSSNPAQIKLYVRNGENQEKQVERIHPGDIIVATNLAGRGTDIKTVEVEKFGGLHVILTFLPESLRVEEQAFGRTSRQGNKGSGQLIVMSSAQAQDLAVVRDQAEREQLESYVHNQLKVINTKDKLFARFCATYQEIRKHLRENPVDRTVVNRATSVVKRKFGGETLTALELTVLRAVEELWAVFLKRIDDGELALEEALSAYEDFEKELRKHNFAADSFFERTENCFYWIQFANEFYRRDGKSNDKALQADKYFQRAIKEEPEFVAGAYAGRAYTLLKGQVHAVRFNSHDAKYKEESIKFLNSALKIIYTEIALYTTAQTVLQNRSADHVSSDLFNQLTSKVGLLGDYARNLGDVLSTVRKSLRAVECTGVSSRLQATAHLPDQTKEVPFQDYSSYNLAIHDLTSRHDITTIDQAVNTVDRAAEKDRNVSVGLQIDNQNLKTLAEVISSEAKDGNLKLSGLKLCDVEALGTISAKSFALEFGGAVAEIEKLVPKLKLKEFQVCFEEPSKAAPTVFKKSMSGKDSIRAALPPSVKQAEIIVQFDKFEELKASAHLLPESSKLAITFNDIDLKEIIEKWNVLQNFNSNSIAVSNLKAKTAKILITALREKQLDFILRLENLSVASANFVLAHSEDRAQEEIVQQDLKNLNEQFSAEFLPLDELRELAQRGIELMAKFNELAFVPWRSVICMGLLATVQVAAGAALVCTGFGASLGMSLITEGLSDYVTTWRAYSNRGFDWTGYAKQKAVSLTLSAVTLGWGALKDGAKGATSVAGSAVSEVTEQAGVMVVTQGKTMTEVVKVSGKKLYSLVGRQVLVQGTETAARVALNSMVDSLVQFSFDQVRGEICAEINTVVDREFKGKEFKEALGTYSAIDSIGQKQLAAKISRWVNDMTNPQSAGWNKTWDTIGWPLCQGILSDPQYLGSTFSMAMRITSTLAGMHQIATAVEKVCNGIYEKICSENKSNTPAHLIHSYCSVTVSTADVIITNMEFDTIKEFKVLKFPPQKLLDEHMVKLNDLQDLFNKLYSTRKNFKVEGNYDISKVIKSVVDALTAQIIHVANRQLASPWTTMAVGSMVAGISREIQSRFLVSDAHMSMDQERMLELKKRDPNSLNDEERAFLRANDRPITIADQIRGVAKDHNVAYQKREMVARILEMNTADSASQKEPSEQTRAAIESALTGGPADVSTVFMLAKLNGKNVKVVDSADYKATKEEDEAGVSIIVFEKSTKPGGLGHYSIRDPQTGEIKQFPSDGNFDCAYQVLGDITGKSVNELRAQAATFIVRNVEKYERIQESAQWIRDRHPQDAAGLLMLGGAEDEERRKRYKRISNEERQAVRRQAKRNGEAVFEEDEEGKGDLHLKSVTQRISLKKNAVTSDGEVTEFEEGTVPLDESKRRQETQMINEVIQETKKSMEGSSNEEKRAATANLFVLKTIENPDGAPHSVGLTMATGHLGSEKNGQVGRDENLIMKTQSCNLKYNRKFERPLDAFIKSVQSIDPNSEAYVKVNYHVPEYGTLVRTDADGNVLEVPFAPEFNVQFSLEGNTNPEIQREFDAKFKNLRPEGTAGTGSYSVNFTNDYPSKMTLPDGYVVPDADSECTEWESSSVDHELDE